ncbi:bis(5'-adenosyl)-triphosphatase enpp4-like [Euwallacea similis]|uniref:bis(5'-adenosyl)-triphosphatase enpp4-like n=1 Tax=Euwallacea similis TaxID=1736056 RepID=UPI00345065FB
MLWRSYWFLLLAPQIWAISKHPVLVVVSYDAFRYNFFDTEKLPHMESIRKQGVYADYLVNVFPTKTFPNHHTIATGLYTEVHGVVGNTYYDPDEKKVVKIGYEMYHYNDEVVPIWRLNEDLGDERYSGTVMWPGADYPYQNKNVTYKMPFQAGFDWHKRVDQVISWITDPLKPANLVLLYFEEPDTHGHAFGPNSLTVKNLILQLDNITGYLHLQLSKRGLTDKVNVIHVSDHGMTAVTPPRFVNVTQFMTNGTYEWTGASPAIQIIPHAGFHQTIYDSLKKGSLENGHFRVYNKSDFPERWHYKNNKRSPPILVMADEGYALDDLIISAPKYALNYNFTLTNSSEFGVHGYDYVVSDMHPYFMAIGPKLKKHTKISPFNTIDLFNIFCAILELPPPRNNGTLIAADQILLAANVANYDTGTIVLLFVGGVLLVLILVGMAVMFTLMLIKRQQNITTAAALNKRFPQTFQNYIEAQHLLDPEEA